MRRISKLLAFDQSRMLSSVFYIALLVPQNRSKVFYRVVSVYFQSEEGEMGPVAAEMLDPSINTNDMRLIIDIIMRMYHLIVQMEHASIVDQ